jgi:hypothetical protein
MPNSMVILISTGHPWRPPGNRGVAHEKPDQQASWNPCGIDEYYLGPDLDHYRCYQVHITKTKGIQIFDTVEFFSSKTAMPQTSSKDLAIIAALELSNALQNPAPAAPFSHIGTVQLQALRQLSEIFSAALPSTTAKHAPPVSQASKTMQEHSPSCPCVRVIPPIQHPPVPAMPSRSPRLARYPSQWVSPRQAQYPRVAPRMNPVDVSSPRAARTLPRNVGSNWWLFVPEPP